MIEKLKKGFYFIPIGGTGEFGASLNLYVVDGEILIIDMGVSFDKDMAMDVLIPDPSLLVELKPYIKGIVLTHAHEDHYGSIPYILPSLNVPVYGSKFSIEMLKDKMKEFGGNSKVKYVPFEAGSIAIGNNFKLDLVPVVHSIPDSYAIILNTKYGKILHTGDWKFGRDIVTGYEFNENVLKKHFEDANPLAIVCDSTGVSTKEGVEVSEDEVRENLYNIISNVKHERVVVSLFSSNITRLETLSIIAEKCNRKLLISGRSLKRAEKIARECGFLKNCPEFDDESKFKNTAKEKVLLVCTGSQGEEKSAMYRIAKGIHNSVKLDVGDWVLFSAKAIPGNEKEIIALQNYFVAKGIKIVSGADARIHSSGHQTSGDLKKLYTTLKPDSVIPVHGDFIHLYKHRDFSFDCGVGKSPILNNGDCYDLLNHEISCKIKTNKMSVDGVKIIPIDGRIVYERKQILQNGFVNVILRKELSLKDSSQVEEKSNKKSKNFEIAEIQFVGLFEFGEDKEMKSIKKTITSNINKKLNTFNKEKAKLQYVNNCVERAFAKLRGKSPFIQIIII